MVSYVVIMWTLMNETEWQHSEGGVGPWKNLGSPVMLELAFPATQGWFLSQVEFTSG